MELIAASRIIKAHRAAEQGEPFITELIRAVSAVATYSNDEHPLTSSPEKVRRVAMLVITSDRGMNGAYSANAIKTAARLTYTSVAAILKGDKKERAHYKALVQDLEMMKETAEALRAQRLREGSLDFDLVEPELVYEEGKLLNVVAAMDLWGTREPWARRLIEGCVGIEKAAAFSSNES